MVVQVVENDAVGKLFIMKVPKATASLAKNQANRILPVGSFHDAPYR